MARCALSGLLLSSCGYLALALNDCQDGTCSAHFIQMQSSALKQTHPWPHARGSPPRQFGTTPEVWTSHKLSWSFHDPAGKYHNIFAGGPVIDQDKNLFQMSAKGVYAFNSSGRNLWHYDPPGISNNEVSLYGDLVLGSTKTGNAFAVNRKTGEEVWVTNLAKDAGGDCGYPGASEGVFVVGAEMGHDPASDGGNVNVFGVDAKTGEKLWEYGVDKPVWNLTPLFPGDGSTVFMDFAGGMYKLNLKTGAEVWKTLPETSRASFSDGGATLGPNGLVYTCSNFGENRGSEGTTGMVRAFRLDNGTQAWYKMTTMPCNSYPAVGHIHGVSPLAVVVTPGSFMGQENLHGQVLALNANTGEQLWRHDMKPYSGLFGMAAGDTEGSFTRQLEGIQQICLPAHWSAPMIDGDGMVIAGRSDGNMYKVFGPTESFKGTQSQNMTVDSGTISEKIPLGSAFLHGALAAAPGIFAISSCDTLFVFQK